jgi:hypothetical protein
VLHNLVDIENELIFEKEAAQADADNISHQQYEKMLRIADELKKQGSSLQPRTYDDRLVAGNINPPSSSSSDHMERSVRRLLL